MANWNRRRFLTLVASAGVSAYGSLVGRNARTYRAGMDGWHKASEAMASILRAMPSVDLAGIATRETAGSAWTGGGRNLFRGSAPVVYSDLGALTRSQTLDFLYVRGLPRMSLPSACHLLVESGAVGELASSLVPDRCIQRLPHFEFSGLGRAGTETTGEWNTAVIDCHAALPDGAFGNRNELSAWIHDKAGDAIDFAIEMTDFGEVTDISGIAGPGETPSMAKFLWHFTNANGKRIDLSLCASAGSSLPVGIRVYLKRSGHAVAVAASPRSGQFTRLLIEDLLDKIGSGAPESLLYGPEVAARSSDAIRQALSAL